MNTIFCENLKKIRKDRGFTQKQVSQQLNVVESCYANWEQGRTEPSTESIDILCTLFEVSADYLLGREDDFGVLNRENNKTLTTEESELITYFKFLPAKAQQLIMDNIKYLVGLLNKERYI